MISPFLATLAFLEAFFTVEVAGLGGVMLSGNMYVWPSYPALFFISCGATLAGFRRLNALYKTP